MLEDERFGREVILIGNDAGVQEELLLSLKSVGVFDQTCGKAARQEIARRAGR